MSAASVRPWGCMKCGASAGEPCRSLTTNRITDTHVERLAWDGLPTTREADMTDDEGAR